MLFNLLILFVAVPALEIILLFHVGRLIGGWETFGVIVVTGVLGASLARREGLRAWNRIRSAMAEGRVPGAELVDGALILVAGAVLLTPGFITDFTGFFLLLPPGRALVRRWLLAYFGRKIASGQVSWTGNGNPAPGPTTAPDDDVIDVEAEVRDHRELPPE